MKQLWTVIITAVIFLAGCTTTSNVDSYIVSLEQAGTKRPGTFFILKGNDNEFINNVDFKTYADYLSGRLVRNGWTPASYGEADVFLFFEYGIDAFYRSAYRVKLSYDEETGITSWLRMDSEIERMIFTRLTAADAGEYRLKKKQSVRWDLLVREPGNTVLSDTAVNGMIDAGLSSLR